MPGTDPLFFLANSASVKSSARVSARKPRCYGVHMSTSGLSRRSSALLLSAVVVAAVIIGIAALRTHLPTDSQGFTGPRASTPTTSGAATSTPTTSGATTTASPTSADPTAIPTLTAPSETYPTSFVNAPHGLPSGPPVQVQPPSEKVLQEIGIKVQPLSWSPRYITAAQALNEVYTNVRYSVDINIPSVELVQLTTDRGGQENPDGTVTRRFVNSPVWMVTLSDRVSPVDPDHNPWAPSPSSTPPQQWDISDVVVFLDATTGKALFGGTLPRVPTRIEVP